MKTNHHLRLSAMGAAALLAACMPFGSAAALPAGYVPLEYISVDGSAKPYIDTGHLPTSNTKIAIDMAYLGAGGTDAWIPIWGYRKTYNADQYAFFISKDCTQFALNYKATDTKSTSGVSLGERFIFRNDNARHYVTRLERNEAETCIYNAADQSFTAGSGWTVTIFGMRGTSVSTFDCRKVKMRLYGFKIWEGTSLVRDFVPVRRESDSAIGLFDVASENGTFYANAGTGSLAAGPVLDGLDIDGTPDEYGEPTPTYGFVEGLAAGYSLPVSCPAAYTNDSLRAICTGWKLYDFSGNLLSHGTETAFTYVHPSPAAYRRLEWQWRVAEYRVSATATTGGSVSPAEQWVEVGATATITAVPAEGCSFVRWKGADASLATSPQLTVEVTAPATYTAIFGNPLPPVFVKSDATGDADGTTWRDAFKTIGAGVAAAIAQGGGAVRVAGGL